MSVGDAGLGISGTPILDRPSIENVHQATISPGDRRDSSPRGYLSWGPVGRPRALDTVLRAITDTQLVSRPRVENPSIWIGDDGTEGRMFHDRDDGAAL